MNLNKYLYYIMHRNGLITKYKIKIYKFVLLSLQQNSNAIRYLNSMCERIGAKNINDIVSLKPVLVTFIFTFDKVRCT